MNRQYQNGIGRFQRPDPVAGALNSPQSHNRYAYTMNDPVNLVDPFGLDPVVLIDGVQIGGGGFKYGPDGVYGGYYGGPSFAWGQIGSYWNGEEYRGIYGWFWIDWGYTSQQAPGPGGLGVPVLRVVQQAYRRPGRDECVKALRILGNRVREFGAGIYGAMERGGLDAEHHKKLGQVRTSIKDALDDVRASCFDKNGTPRFPDLTSDAKNNYAIEAAEKVVARDTPPVGWGADFPNVTHWKIGAAIGTVGSAIALPFRYLQWALGSSPP